MFIKKFSLTVSLLLSILTVSCENFILGPDIDNTPINNFNELWKEFDLYYPSFIVKNINWDSLYSIYGDSITAQTTENRLWEIVSGLMFNLNDVHVFMYNRNHSKSFTASKSDSGHYGEFSLSLVKSIYLSSFSIAGEGNFTYGRILGDSIGYMYIKSFSGDGLWAQDIDKIVAELSNTRAIIIDIRDNNGGNYHNYKFIASAFVNKPITYLIEKARNGPRHENFTAPFYHTVAPRRYALQYTKRIVLLSNRITASASEHFALIFKHLPYSTQIGDTTAGGLGFSNREFQLLNGWIYHMPLSLCLTVDGQSLEGIGVVPDIFKRNSKEEIEKGYDRVLEYAIQYLSR